MIAWNSGMTSGQDDVRVRQALSILVQHPVISLFLFAFWIFASWSSIAAGQGTESTDGEKPITGNEPVFWITPSPAFERSGVALAVGLPTRGGCIGPCLKLWVTRDGGSTWALAESRGFPGGFRPIIAVDAEGRETIFGPVEGELLRSDDFGQTWIRVGPQGFPAASPNFARDQMVAVAGGDLDYVLQAGQISHVPGSAGKLRDIGFFLAPEFPESGEFPAAHLVGLDKETARPLVQQCSSDFACSGSTVLVGTSIHRYPIALHASSDYATDGVVFAVSGSVYKSTDGGRNFKQLRVVDSGEVAVIARMIAVHPEYKEAGSNRTLYVALSQVFTKEASGGSITRFREGGVFQSTDGGENWKKVGQGSPLDQGANAVALAPDGRLFAGYLKGQFDGGLLCSQDGGKSWKATCSGPTQSAASASSETRADTAAAEHRPPFLTMILLGFVALGATVAALVWSRRREAEIPSVPPATATDDDVLSKREG